MVIFMKFSRLGYMKKIIPVRRNPACMKAGSRLSGTFFIHVTPRRDDFWYIHGMYAQTHINKVLEKSTGEKLQFIWINKMVDDLISC